MNGHRRDRDTRTLATFAQSPNCITKCHWMAGWKQRKRNCATSLERIVGYAWPMVQRCATRCTVVVVCSLVDDSFFVSSIFTDFILLFIESFRMRNGAWFLFLSSLFFASAGACAHSTQTREWQRKSVNLMVARMVLHSAQPSATSCVKWDNRRQKHKIESDSCAQLLLKNRNFFIFALKSPRIVSVKFLGEKWRVNRPLCWDGGRRKRASLNHFDGRAITVPNCQFEKCKTIKLKDKQNGYLRVFALQFFIIN